MILFTYHSLPTLIKSIIAIAETATNEIAPIFTIPNKPTTNSPMVPKIIAKLGLAIPNIAIPINKNIAHRTPSSPIEL